MAYCAGCGWHIDDCNGSCARLAELEALKPKSIWMKTMPEIYTLVAPKASKATSNTKLIVGMLTIRFLRFIRCNKLADKVDRYFQ